jgi:hypothetical protein
MSEEEKTRVDLNPVQVVASALAAVSSAVLLSTVGVAGTVIGAAAGSVIATVCTGIYSYSLKVSRQRVAAAAQAAAMARFAKGGRDGDTVQQTEVPPEEIERHRSEEEKAARPSWREALAALPWKWVAIVAGAVFVVAMIVILSFELITGRAVSTYTGGTDGTERTSLGGGGSKPTPTLTPSVSPSSSPSASSSSSSSPTESAIPSDSPTQSSSPTGSASPSQSVTGTPSTSSTPTDSATASSSPVG